MIPLTFSIKRTADTQPANDPRITRTADAMKNLKKKTRERRRARSHPLEWKLRSIIIELRNWLPCTNTRMI